MQMLNWASRFNICCFLDNHQYQLQPHAYECLLGAGAVRELRADAGFEEDPRALEALDDFCAENDDWLFGHLGFDLKNETGPFSSSHTDLIGFPDLFFFVPRFVIELSVDCICIGLIEEPQKSRPGESTGQVEGLVVVDPDQAWKNIFQQIQGTPSPGDLPAVREMGPLQARFSRDEYILTVQRLREHILRGDCYEINFCQEFFVKQARLDPVPAYLALSKASPTPFGAFYKLEDKYLLCASPERYLCRKGQTLLSQPIKGTWTRDRQNPAQDDLNKVLLYHSEKDRSENVMVVDLVRNDLSKICLPGTVRVDELYGIYPFPQVYQMISTVSGEIPAGTSLLDCIRASFPMGSMTGAPKKRVLELIEQYEKTRRGLFSGSLGYMLPVDKTEDTGSGPDLLARDFDFNVVIRSVFYDAGAKHLSYQVGSGITFNSIPESEYEECLLKAEGIHKALGI